MKAPETISVNIPKNTDFELGSFKLKYLIVSN